MADDFLDTQVKAKLDDSELSDDLPKALQKVDLDLDDAPFLEDEEDAPATPEASAEPFPEEAPAEEQKPSRKKFIFIGAAALILLLGGAAAFFLLRKPAAPPVQAPPPVAPEAEPAVPPAPPPVLEPPKPPQPELVMPMAPFLVEMTDATGRTRFLNLRFTAVTTDPAVRLEFMRNTIVLRDAVYYYLKNKSMEFLTEKKNTETLKKDVLSVINQFIGAQPLDNLLIEEYLVK
jgi:flagellar FliL protein